MKTGIELVFFSVYGSLKKYSSYMFGFEVSSLRSVFFCQFGTLFVIFAVLYVFFIVLVTQIVHNSFFVVYLE